MAEQLGVEWQFANLFSRTQWTARGVGPEYQDPTPAVCSWLGPEHHQTEIFADNYRRLAAGEPLRNPVDLARGY